MFKDSKYDRKRRVNAFIVEIKGGVVTGVYRVKRPRHLTAEVMIVDLDSPSRGRDIHAAPADVVPIWKAGPETIKAVDKLQNMAPEPPEV